VGAAARQCAHVGARVSARAARKPAWLTALGAVAAAEVVEQFTGQHAQIKWPNDVRVGGRKIAGVLVERAAGAVIGIGLNANITRGEFPEALRAECTSVQILTGERADRSELARALIRRLDAIYAEGLSAGPGPLPSPGSAGSSRSAAR